MQRATVLVNSHTHLFARVEGAVEVSMTVSDFTRFSQHVGLRGLRRRL